MSNVLLGTCIADALGKFAESKPATYQPLLDWDGESFIGSKHHGLQPNMYTDDGQFSCCVAVSLIENNGFNPEDLSKRYVELFDSKTIRGYGTTTLNAINNLRNGVHYSKSGIVGSFGNGSSMRSAPYAIYFRNDIKTLIESVKIDSAITHNSEDAEAGALAIALAAYYAVNNDMENLLEKICQYLPECKVKRTVSSLDALIDSNDISHVQALRLLGTKCNVQETVPSSIYLFLKMKNYQEGITAAIRAGFDTDTTAAIVGALFAAKDGIKDILPKWISQIEDRDLLMNLDNQLYDRSPYFPRK